MDGSEYLLGLLGLSGPVEENLKKTIWEMNHIRNVLVHRASCADVRLVEACPWLGLKVGEPVIVKHEALERYGSALVEYTMQIARRLGKHYDVDIDALIRAAREKKGGGPLSTCGEP